MITSTEAAREFDPEKLKELRGRRITQAEVAAACGLPLETYRAYEQGRRVPNADNLARLSIGLRVPMDELFREVVPG